MITKKDVFEARQILNEIEFKLEEDSYPFVEHEIRRIKDIMEDALK